MRQLRVSAAALSLALLTAPAPSPAAAPAAAVSVADLAWLAGCWAAEGAEPGSEEHWLAPAGGTLLGMSRTVRGGRTVAHEFLQIREQEPGRVVFIAKPSGQPEATFALASSDPRALVFENPAHDFPQRVIYRLDGETLRARIEGTEGGEAKGFDFPLRRIACSGG